MLYEAGLNWFAIELERFSDYNIAGNTLTEIMDGIPKSLFGKMNIKYGAVLLRDYDRRDFFQKAYLWYPELFQEPWSKYQCHFFENYLWPGDGYTREKFDEILSEENRKILAGIGTFKSETAYGRYLCYRKIRDAMLNDIWLPCFPKKQRHWLRLMAEELYKYFLAENAEQVRSLVEKNLCYCPRYETRDEKYIVGCPHSLLELFEESRITGNIFWADLNRVADGSVRILFCRKACNPERVFLVFKIIDGRLIVFSEDQYWNCEKETSDWLREYAVSNDLIWKEG